VPISLLILLCCRLSILDLVVAMSPYANEQALGSLYRTIQPSLQVGLLPAPAAQQGLSLCQGPP